MTKETVNHPDHYNGNCSVECIDAIVGMLGIEATVHFCLGNAIKYMWRKDYKGKGKEDMRKASWYLTQVERLSEEYDDSKQYYDVIGRITDMYCLMLKKDEFA